MLAMELAGLDEGCLDALGVVHHCEVMNPVVLGVLVGVYCLVAGLVYIQEMIPKALVGVYMKVVLLVMCFGSLELLMLEVDRVIHFDHMMVS